MADFDFFESVDYFEIRADAPYYLKFEIIGNIGQPQGLETYLVKLGFADRCQVVVEDIIGTSFENFPLTIFAWRIGP